MINLLIGAIDASIEIGPIKLSLIDILLHLLNLAILVVGLTFLLYKPILKFINERKQKIEAEIKKGEDMQTQAEAKREEYEEKIAEAKEEAQKIREDALKAAEESSQKILADAKEEAQRLKDNTEKECVELKRQAVDEVRSEVTDTVIQIATQVIKREVSKEDNQKIIDDCIEQWSEDADV